MKYRIVYDAPGRLRLRCGSGVFSKKQEESVESVLCDIDGVVSVKASAVNGGILFYYTGAARELILQTVSELCAGELAEHELSSVQMIDAKFQKELYRVIRRRILTRLFVPSFLRLPLTVWRAVPFVRQGAKCLLSGHLSVDVLDALSISAAILSGTPSTASSVMTLLNISELLEGYTRKKAKNALSDSLAFNIEKVWKLEDGQEISIPLAEASLGDILRVRQGSMIPLDGIVRAGSAGVNEASMTGESIPRLKSAGMSVYAGTAVEEGSIDFEVTKLLDDSRIHGILEMIENSEELKSGVQTKAEKFAESLVPVSLLTSAAVYLLTGNITKALSALMVDYSCAIKLSTPICVISAMREATNYDIMIKGGRYLENYSFADTIVFDKTGTLTVSCPTLCRVEAFCGYQEDEILKIAACLEEHFPHSVAKAVVHAAEIRGLEHMEEHAEVRYIVAHGIASDLKGERTLIGSAHFVFDDEKIPVSEEKRRLISELSKKYSMIYLAVGGKLCGILCIEDPIRPEAADVIGKLKEKGFSDILMITGDGETTAENVCRELGIDRFYAKVLPEDKLRIVNEIKQEGHKVVMVGDGINDSPALAAADVSVAMKDASDIAREVAEITLLSSDLERLVILRNLSENLFRRIHANYRFIAAFNSALLALGIGGVISPVISAFMHNLSTMGVCLGSMKPFLKQGGENVRGNKKEISVYHL